MVVVKVRKVLHIPNPSKRRQMISSIEKKVISNPQFSVQQDMVLIAPDKKSLYSCINIFYFDSFIRLMERKKRHNTVVILLEIRFFCLAGQFISKQRDGHHEGHYFKIFH